jgi:hypothetical protein
MTIFQFFAVKWPFGKKKLKVKWCFGQKAFGQHNGLEIHDLPTLPER